MTVTVTNAKTASTPKPAPSGEPTHRPTPTTPGRYKPRRGTGEATPSTSYSDTPASASSTPAESPAGDAAPKEPTGSLAHTGADATPWLIGGAAALVAAGASAFAVARRSRTDRPADDSTQD
ncbi:LAETG motif-containing sortase-dependent surface protein [Streptomyces sp. S3(2020)]|uniref:LAETG motif-containing sortase-dependent surface protein n=1 Tax=Streptomyces sp. S3(2020) TaxID=2732044 RepID=UPI0019D251FE